MEKIPEAHKGRDFFVKPTWKSVKKKKGLVVIDIDPGMAFGSGSHDTTKSCLKAISLIFSGPSPWFKNPVNETFLDVGTGSGILAIAAKKLGVKKVVAIDNDPIAIKVASGNAGLNKVKISVSRVSGIARKGRFSVVAANIQSNTLLRLKKTFFAKVAPKGVLVLSGILAAEADCVEAAYEKTGLKLNHVIKGREWRTLIFKKVRRFYAADLSEGSEMAELSGTEFRHLKTVLRLKEGSEIVLFNGRGLEFIGVLESIGKGIAKARIISRKQTLDRSPVDIILFQAFFKRR